MVVNTQATTPKRTAWWIIATITSGGERREAFSKFGRIIEYLLKFIKGIKSNGHGEIKKMASTIHNCYIASGKESALNITSIALNLVM
ncbi:hypothetical protein RF55_17458 [Lasius niger]|uniref:Uncharacterized protein n=1 Tax=Lasius niger TaxID=67767 RepID=A0A0J7K2T6_LASNI|nr:hypothetical protein RF55_17458 [Lasius niger]